MSQLGWAEPARATAELKVVRPLAYSPGRRVDRASQFPVELSRLGELNADRRDLHADRIGKSQDLLAACAGRDVGHGAHGRRRDRDGRGTHATIEKAR